MKVCVVTGSRAEWGLLSGLARVLDRDSRFKLQIIATNMHLSHEFGYTYKEIEQAGFSINKKVEMLLSSDTANATVKSIGLAAIGFADAYEELRPDILVVLGDRYEMLAAVTAALIFKIPVAHLHGGEVTVGAYDDAIRHAITKMSHIHFTSTEEYKKRVIQLGENPERVFNVGAIGVANIKEIKLLSKAELEKSLGFYFSGTTILVTYHPVTLDDDDEARQFKNLLNVLDKQKGIRIVFTMPNSDTGGRVIIHMINDFVKSNADRAIAFTSLGQLRYLSSLQYVTAVVGNSSSGIIEMPSFGKPTLNIGQRQQGRIAADSVIHCGTSEKEIEDGLNKILSDNFILYSKNVRNPYEGEDTIMNIVNVLANCRLKGIIEKSFYNLEL